MTNIQKAYIAGFFDGEGCISIVKSASGGRSTRTYHKLDASISQKDPATLLWLKAEYSGNLLHNKQGAGFYVWKLTNNLAYRFLCDIRPYAKYKAIQIDLALKFQRQEVMRRGRTPRPLSSDEIRRREWYRSELRRLKTVFTPA